MKGKLEFTPPISATFFRIQRIVNSFGVFILLLFVLYSVDRYFTIAPHYADFQSLHELKQYGFVGSAPRRDTLKIPILMYHYVEHVEDQKDTIRKSLNILPEIFENQILTLKRAGYSFITMKDIGNILEGKKTPRDKFIVLTFDDGYRDFYTDVYPILKKYSVHATQYLVAGFTGQPNYMTHDQIAEIQQSGLVEFGVHTIHHINLRGRGKEEVQTEVYDGKKILENEFHMSIVSFAYPYGSFDDQAVSIVSKGSYTTAVSTVSGVHEELSNRFILPRLRPGINTEENLIHLITQ